MSEIIDIFYYGLKQMIMILGKYWYKHHEDGKTEDFASKKCYAQSDINSLITMNCIVTPSILPSCAIFYEEGCAFLDGRNKINMLCSTHTGIIR